MAEERNSDLNYQGTARWPESGSSKSIVTPEGYIEPKPKASVGSDVAKSVATQAPLGVLDTVIGGIGGLGQLYDLATGYVPLKIGEMAGLLPPGKTASGMYSEFSNYGRTPAEKKGYVNRILGMPFLTPSGAQEVASRAVPALRYQPQTREGEVAGSMTRFGTSMLSPLGWESALQRAPASASRAMTIAKEAGKRVGLGGIMGGGAEAGSELAQRSNLGEYDPLARFAGSVAPLALGRVTKPGATRLLFPEQAAAEEVANAIGTDRARGIAAMSQADIDNIMAYGEHPTLLEAGGPKTKQLASKYAYEAPSENQAALEFFKTRAQRLNLPAWMADIFGIPQNAGDEALALTKNRQAENNINYRIARENENANSMWSSGLKSFAEDKLLKPIMEKVNSYSGRFKYDADGNPIPGSEIVGYSPASATFRGTAPNLNYWHEVRLLLRDEIKALRKEGRDTEASVYQGELDKLTKEMGTIVPEYTTARLAAHKLFGTEDAYEAGFNLLSTKNVISNARKLDEGLNTFTGDQRDTFASGLMSQLKTLAEGKRGTKGLLETLKNPNSAAAIIKVIGKDKYETLVNAAEADLHLSRGAMPAGVEGGSFVQKYGPAGFYGATLGAIGSGLQYLLWTAPSAINAVYTALAAGASVAGKAAFSSAEKRIAPRVLNILLSNDPERFAQISRLSKENAEVNSALGKMNWAASRFAPAYVRSNPLSDNREEKPSYQMEIMDSEQNQPNSRQSSLSPSEREVDLATRMILGEAGNQSDAAKAAVMHTALNRARMSGEPLDAVINRPNAFEAVTSGKTDAFSPESKEYQYIKNNIVLPSLQGKLKDPTDGATYFLNPDLQTQLGRNQPKWASGEGKRIGDHVFYNLPYGGKPREQNRVGRASGGRITNHKSEAENLIRMADKVKKALNNSTESLLSVPDEAVTKALSIANEAI